MQDFVARPAQHAGVAVGNGLGSRYARTPPVSFASKSFMLYV